MSIRKCFARHAVSILAILMVLLSMVATSVAAGSNFAAQQPVKDAWITMKIHSLFLAEDALDGSNIDVDTNKGVVTLSGTVVTEAGRARAVAIAKGTDGAKSVVDKLRIGPAQRELDDIARSAAKDASAAAKEAGKDTKAASKASGRKITDGWVKSKIYAQLLTESALDDSDIDIDVANGVVTLNGTVKTAAGKARAVEIARATDRVKSVKDNLKVG